MHARQEGPHPADLVVRLLAQPHALNAGSFPFDGAGHDEIEAWLLAADPTYDPLLDGHLEVLHGHLRLVATAGSPCTVHWQHNAVWCILYIPLVEILHY